MARLPRLYAPDTPQLVQARFVRPLAAVQDPTPAAPLDLIRTWLATESRQHAIALHGWAILLDRIIVLATPTQNGDLSKLMQGLGRRMAARMVHGRVFQERYRSTLVEDAWVPACLVWLESSPVREGLVDTATRWPWSSAQEHVGLRPDSGMLSDHPSYWHMGNTPYARQAHHKQLLLSDHMHAQSPRIEQALRGQWALGSEEFLARLVSRSSRRAAPAPRGRPRKPPNIAVVTK